MKKSFLIACFTLVGLATIAAESEQSQGNMSNPTQTESGIWAPVTLDVKPVDSVSFVFGEFQKVAFTLKNVSDWRIVVTSIQPVVNWGEEAISLFGAVYGKIDRDSEKDLYIYNMLSQRRTKQTFYEGLLLPGESVTIHHVYRPVAQKEQFRVSYCVLDKTTSNDRQATTPLAIYIPNVNTNKQRRPATSRMSFKVNTNRWSMSSLYYYPFDIKRWKALNQVGKPITRIGTDCSYRAVLIPDLHDFRKIVLSDPKKTGWSRSVQSYTKVIPISCDSDFITFETALKTVGRIIPGKRFRECKVIYCRSLSGYLVSEVGYSWILTNPNQTNVGTLLPGKLHPLLAKEIDVKGSIRVKVGDKQVGFGSDVEKADWKFWDHYPVIYGDGMYTQGEFIEITQEQLLDFLRAAYQKGFVLNRRPYYFDSAYYVLEAS